MRHVIRDAAFVIMMVLLSCFLVRCDSTGPGGGGGGGGEVETDYTIPPFNVVQYSTDFEGASGQVVVGGDGVALAVVTGTGIWVIPTEDQTDLNGVWSWKADSFFVVGDRGGDGKGVIYRFAGGKRTRMSHGLTGDVTGIHGASWNRVYAVGSYGGIIRYNGESWNSVYQAGTGSLSDVWVSRSGDVWAVGGGKGVYHFDGTTWHDLSGTGIGHCRAVWGLSPDTVLVTLDNEVWRFHQPVAGEPAGELLFTSSTDFVFFGIHASGGDWIVAVGSFGTTAAYDGSGWTEERLGTDYLREVTTEHDLFGRLAIVFGYNGSVYYYDGAWEQWNLSTVEDWSDIGGVPGFPDVLYGIRGGDLMRFGGFPPRWYVESEHPSVTLRALYCTGENEVWALGSSTDPGAIDRFAYAYNGFMWLSYWLSSDSDPRDIWCADRDRVCIVGDNATVWYRRYDSGVGWYFTPTQAVTPPEDLHGVWGYTYGDLYAVGDNGTIVYSDDEGANWTSMTSNTSAHLRDVWGWAADSVVAVGDGGTVMFFNGSVWTAMSAGVTGDLYSVWCGGYDDIWAANIGNMVLHWDGTSWELLDTGLPIAPIRKVWGCGGDVWFVCGNDYVLTYMPTPW